jgi:UDP-glucose 4-epimerase
VIARGAAPLCLNLGGGQGTTVKEVLTAVGEVVGRAVPFRVAPRRAGDVAQLVADIGEARRVLDWTPSRSSIRQIVADAAALR